MFSFNIAVVHFLTCLRISRAYPSNSHNSSRLLTDLKGVTVRELDGFKRQLSSPSDVQFWLFRSNFPDIPEIITLDRDGQFNFSSSKIDTSSASKLIIHGYGTISTVFNEIFKDMVQEYINRYDNSANVIFVFWATERILPSYSSALQRVPLVGRMIARFIEEAKLDNDIHLIGYSLGAHVAGIAGKSASRRINRITGLDPAGPGFDAATFRTRDRLTKDDADFVDIVHSNAGELSQLHFGIGFSIGDLDFYPNGGRYQPMCGSQPTILDQVCSHSASALYHMLSINRRQFTAHPCNATSIGFVHTVMGEDAHPRASGDYCLTVEITDAELKKYLVPEVEDFPGFRL